ncbi:MAG: acyl-ACP thioesterase, partial [Tissierellia bacterium]|nr:acyl-ACP thioesterase [Tissierellia bacterium]
MDKIAFYRKDYRIRPEHVDFNGKLKLSSLFTYFQDIAGLHAEELGMGMEYLYKKHNVLWVLARIKVNIDKYPSWNDDITIETWPQKPSRMGFERDFLVKDQQGSILAKCISSWVLIDADTRRLKPTKNIFIGY